AIEEPEEPEPSWFADMLDDLFAFLGDLFDPVGGALGSSWPILKWIMIAAAAAMLAYLLWKLLAPIIGRPAKSLSENEDWRPDERATIALLEDADRLAAAGDYDGATHLLLQRSVGQISDAHPGWVEPSSTARELAQMTQLPNEARTAFAVISEQVERSLFALRHLGVDDWQAARDAYARFALQRLSGRPA
ncbi:MAG: hypothetical protein WA908_09335, partial [Pontixanthobacter sp.]